MGICRWFRNFISRCFERMRPKRKPRDDDAGFLDENGHTGKMKRSRQSSSGSRGLLVRHETETARSSRPRRKGANYGETSTTRESKDLVPKSTGRNAARQRKNNSKEKQEHLENRSIEDTEGWKKAQGGKRKTKTENGNDRIHQSEPSISLQKQSEARENVRPEIQTRSKTKAASTSNISISDNIDARQGKRVDAPKLKDYLIGKNKKESSTPDQIADVRAVLYKTTNHVETHHTKSTVVIPLNRNMIEPTGLEPKLAPQLQRKQELVQPRAVPQSNRNMVEPVVAKPKLELESGGNQKQAEDSITAQGPRLPYSKVTELGFGAKLITSQVQVSSPRENSNSSNPFIEKQTDRNGPQLQRVEDNMVEPVVTKPKLELESGGNQKQAGESITGQGPWLPYSKVTELGFGEKLITSQVQVSSPRENSNSSNPFIEKQTDKNGPQLQRVEDNRKLGEVDLQHKAWDSKLQSYGSRKHNSLSEPHSEAIFQKYVTANNQSKTRDPQIQTLEDYRRLGEADPEHSIWGSKPQNDGFRKDYYVSVPDSDAFSHKYGASTTTSYQINTVEATVERMESGSVGLIEYKSGQFWKGYSNKEPYSKQESSILEESKSSTTQHKQLVETMKGIKSSNEPEMNSILSPAQGTYFEKDTKYVNSSQHLKNTNEMMTDERVTDLQCRSDQNPEIDSNFLHEIRVVADAKDERQVPPMLLQSTKRDIKDDSPQPWKKIHQDSEIIQVKTETVKSGDSTNNKPLTLNVEEPNRITDKLEDKIISVDKNKHENPSMQIIAKVPNKDLATSHKIEHLFEESQKFEKLANEFVGKVGTQEHYYIDESLARLLLQLDDLGVLKNETLKLERRKVIKYIYHLLDVLEERATR